MVIKMFYHTVLLSTVKHGCSQQPCNEFSKFIAKSVYSPFLKNAYKLIESNQTNAYFQ